MQLDGLEREGAVDRLVAARADVVVIEPTRTVRGQESFPTASVVARAQEHGLCLAYLNVGQAESYRPYWIRGEWRAPTKDAPGFPSFLVTVDPDGWAGNYPVSFWDKRWRVRLWGSPHALLDQAIDDGFDGVYLDWVLGYREPAIVAAAQQAAVNPARAMAELIRDLRAYARRRKPGFLVVAQNGGPLAEAVPEFYRWVDGVSQESVHFYGNAKALWDDPEAGDQPIPATGDWSTAEHERVLDLWVKRNIPVFVVEYVIDPQHRAAVVASNTARGYKTFVTRSPVDRLPKD